MDGGEGRGFGYMKGGRKNECEERNGDFANTWNMAWLLRYVLVLYCTVFKLKYIHLSIHLE